MAVTHAVVARQIRARFGCRDDVINRHGVFGVRQGNFFDHRALPFDLANRVTHGSVDLWVHTRDEIFFRNADAQPLNAHLQIIAVVRHRPVRGSRVGGIVAGESFEQERSSHARPWSSVRLDPWMKRKR